MTVRQSALFALLRAAGFRSPAGQLRWHSGAAVRARLSRGEVAALPLPEQAVVFIRDDALEASPCSADPTRDGVLSDTEAERAAALATALAEQAKVIPPYRIEAQCLLGPVAGD